MPDKKNALQRNLDPGALLMKPKTDMSAVILAAGFSSRMGNLKALLPLGEKSILAHVVTLFKRAGITDMRVVVGYRAAELMPVIKELGAIPVFNPQYETGMLSSIKAGISSLPGKRGAFFILPVDIPLVRRLTVSDLLAAWKKGKKKILYPAFSGRRGHPPLISLTLREKILSWEGAGGLQSFLAQHEKEAADVPVADEHILFDIDTPRDYQNAVSRLATYDIPTTPECLTMMTRRFASNEPLFEHCVAVAGVAVHLTHILNSAGCKIDPRLVTASGLLHDLLRAQPDHAAAAARMLRRMGYAKVADVVATHMNIRIEEKAPLQAEEVVYLADKLVEGKRVVSLDQRFRVKRMQFAGETEITSAVNVRFQNAVKIKNRFESKTGMSLEAVLSGFSPPSGPGYVDDLPA
jgi:molybdenum cofactor cytidylyltransferase